MFHGLTNQSITGKLIETLQSFIAFTVGAIETPKKLYSHY